MAKKYMVNPSLLAWGKSVVIDGEEYGAGEFTLPAKHRQHTSYHFGDVVPSFLPAEDVPSDSVDNTDDDDDF